MAVRISPPENKTYYINPAYLSFVENSGYGANLIQVSASSSCYISVYDPANGIGYSDADRNYQRWKVTAYNNKFPNDDLHYIYVRLERESTSALVVYDTVLRGVRGGVITETTDEQGNIVRTETEPFSADHWFIRIGTASEVKASGLREITYDTGYLTSDEAMNDKDSESEMWRLDKYSTPNLIEALHSLKGFVVRGFVKLFGGLVFQKGNTEKPVTDIRRAIDPDNEYLLNADGSVQTDAEGNPMKNPDFVPVNDETLPTTAYLQEKLDGIDDRYLSKVHPDQTEHRIKFLDGIEAGRFNTGPAMAGGSGAQIDRDGRGEMQSLSLREFLEVPELRFNRIDVVSGELWNSIAFGLVESVDTAKRICTLKLEEGERSGLQLNDICRGIFSDFGEGTVTDEGEDHNGFQKMYGFATSYFTPTEILVNEAGRFQFRYNLQEGTTVHPCQSMKFAVYGNFIDTSRQASAYSTRTFKRYLNKVNTWTIDLDKHLYAQFGDVEGLTIGGYTMHGYGSFQSNIYTINGFHQFTPQQMEAMKGEDAYAVQLSNPVGIIIIDDEGRVIGGEQMLMNVVTGGENLTTDQANGYYAGDGSYIAPGDYNVTTGVFKLSTQVIASRGSNPLHHALAYEPDGFTIGLNAVGCKAMVMNGVVVVTEVTNADNCRVDIRVVCEGKSAFDLVYNITAVTDGKNPIVADLDNEVEAVACDPDGAVLFGLPVQTTVSMWAGTRQLRLSDVQVTAPEGVTIQTTYIDQNGTPLDTLTEEELLAVEYTSCIVSIPEGGITPEAARALPIEITAFAWYGNVLYHRNLTFTVNKIIAGENAVIYKLSPSVTSIVKDKSDNLSASEVSCSVVGFNGRDSIAVETLPSHLRMTYSVDGEEAKAYEMNQPLPVSKDNKEFAFALYQTAGEVETQIDYETVPLIRDGIEFKSVSAYIRSNEKPATPTGGTFANPKPDTEGWSLDIPEGESILWVSFRTFVSNDVYAEGDGWSEPSQMTDTATLKVVWSSKEEPATLPDAPEINADWTDDPDANAIWRAETVNTNGVWSKWQVSKVRGKDALRLVASTTTVSRNSFGSYQPAQVRVRVIRGSEEETKYIHAWGIDKDGDAHGVELMKDSGVNYIFASSVDTNMGALESADYASLVFRVYETVAVRDYKADDTEALDQVSIVFVGDGSSGPMPRNRGEYNSNTPYFYNDMYRDFVWRTTSGGTLVYMRQGYGSAYSANAEMVDPGTGEVMQGGIQGIDPYGNTTYWVEVPRTIMTAIDTALIDNANIAGFMFHVDHIDTATGYPVGVIQSQNEKLKLDATNGKLTCVDAAIDGDITIGSLAYKVLYASGGTYDLTGYGMVIGWGTFELPKIENWYSTEIKSFFENWGRALRTCKIKSVDRTPIRYMDSSGYMTEGYEYILPDDNTLYTIILVYDSLESDPYWMVNSSLGASEGGGISLLVDSEMDGNSEYPVQNKVIVNELKKYAVLAGDNSFTGDNEFSGDNDFTGTLSVNGAPIVYNTRYGYWKLDGDLLVTGGVTMYGSDSSFKPSTIMDAINVDGTTISKSGGILHVVGDVGGAGSFWELEDIPDTLAGYGITDAKIVSGTITLGGSTITPLTQTLGDNRYLKLTGGTLKNGSTTSPLALDCTTRTPYITFKNNGVNSGFIGGATSGKTMHIQAGTGSDTEYSIFRVNVDGSLQVSKNATYYDVLTGMNYTSYLPRLNSSSTHATNTSTIYAPTTAGSDGQILKSDGDGAPVWVNQSTLSVGSATKVYIDNNSNTGPFPLLFTTTGAAGTPGNYSVYCDTASGTGYNPANNQLVSKSFAANTGTGEENGFQMDSGKYGINASNDTLIVKTFSKFNFSQSGTTRLYMNENGNFGIKTSSPESALHVAGSITADNQVYVGDNVTIYGTESNPRIAFSHGGNSWYVQCYNNSYMYLGPTVARAVRIDTSGNLLSPGGITMYSDLRKKTILNDVELTLDEVADAPLIEHYYNDDEQHTTHVGSVAQYWAETIGNDWFCKKDEDGYYTMEIQNAALASAISVAREFRRYKEETSALIAEMRREMEALRQEVEQLKRK